MAQLICRACQAEVRPGDFICGSCQANLTVYDAVVDTTLVDLDEVPADAADPAPEVACPHCDAALPSNDEPVCPSCMRQVGRLLTLRLDGTTLDGANWQRQLRPGTTLVLGRNPQDSPAGIVLGRNDAVSRRHAEVRVDAANGLRVADLNSTNGTFVDGVRLDAGATAELRPGSRLGLGSTVAFVVEES